MRRLFKYDILEVDESFNVFYLSIDSIYLDRMIIDELGGVIDSLSVVDVIFVLF